MQGSASGRKVLGLAAIGFGLLTVAAGTRAILGGPAVAGNAVPFVLWFNTAAGLAYVVAGALMFRGDRRAPGLSLAIALATLAVFAAFAVAALRGVPHETRTFGAMTLRSTFWLAAALALRRHDRAR